MVLDSSALVSLVLREAGHERLSAALESADRVLIAAPILFETLMVLSSRIGNHAAKSVDEILRASDAQIVPFAPDHVPLALAAFLSYGKGRHPARLNFGDCMAYAVAKLSAQPLLFSGEDFSQTDIEPA